MKPLISFCKKEFLEYRRTYKFYIIAAVFILFGIMSPMTAKILPEILNGMDMGGMIITLPEPSAIDSWTQFFSNISQMGMIALVIVFCGITSNEFSRGTLINILTKGMKRHTVILSKLIIAVLIWTLSYILSFAVTYAYTAYFWEIGEMPNAFLAFASPWVFGLFLISILILGGVLFKTFYGSLAVTIGAAIIMSILNINPKMYKFNPISLAGSTLNLLNGQSVPGDFIPALIICLALTIIFIECAILIFNKKQL